MMRSQSTAEPVLAVRRGTVDDARAMGRVAYRAVDLDEDRAEEECRRIVREPFAFSVVATSRLPGTPERLVGVVNGVLLRPAFSRALLGSATPFFHNRVRETRTRPFPDEAEVARANGGGGQDLFLAHYAMDGGLTNEEATRVRLALVFSFAERFGGNRARRILVETVGWENTVMATSGGFEALNSYLGWREAHGVIERDGPHLLGVTLEGAMAVQSLHLARLLQYRPPRLRLPKVAREILRLALDGLPDVVIAEARGVTVKAVGSVWTRAFGTAERVLPSLFDAEASGGKSFRRLALLAYLRDYPEELWPYEPPNPAPLSPPGERGLR